MGNKFASFQSFIWMQLNETKEDTIVKIFIQIFFGFFTLANIPIPSEGKFIQPLRLQIALRVGPS